MTRLNDALNRARAAATEPHMPTEPSPPASGGSVGELPRAWQFELTESVKEPAWHGEPSAAEPAEADQFTFGPAFLGKMVVGPDADRTMVEQYRRFAAVLHHAQNQRGARTVMIASAVPAEGKTLTAANLALTLSHSYRRRVLLLDADLRRPSLHEAFQLPNDVGLGDSLRHPAGGRLPVQRLSPMLWALTAGKPVSDPMGGLVSDTMKQLLRDAAEQFDWVVVDTPPVALMPDANLLAAMVDTAVLIVAAQTTPYPLVQRAIDAIGAPRILGVILNRAKESPLGDRYGYYAYQRKSTQH